MDELKPKDHAEAVALFRSEIIGALTRRELDHGELRGELAHLSQVRFRPPGLLHTKTFSVPTLERWYYRYRSGGLEALRPAPRSDRGRAQELTAELRQLILDIRREHRGASVPLILRTLIAEGRLQRSEVSAATIRRLFAENGLDRVAARDGEGGKTRLRWEAAHPGALWHGDVCYGPALKIDDVSRPLRIHALLDDASRHVMALTAFHTEQERDMLTLFVGALRRHGAPKSLYLDNGSTYRGEDLRTVCGRLNIALLHAKPYDAPARGKMERFWRTLREGCLDFMGSLSSLHDVNVRLWSFLDQHYHRAPHAGLLGRTPDQVYRSRKAPADALEDSSIQDALTLRISRRVTRDTTVSVNGRDWEVDLGFLAGRMVTIGYTLLDDKGVPWLEHEGRRRPLHPLDPLKNAHRHRPPRRPGQSGEPPQTGFDPNQALLDRAAGRRKTEEK
jgi:transposase InsO family protein